MTTTFQLNRNKYTTIALVSISILVALAITSYRFTWSQRPHILDSAMMLCLLVAAAYVACVISERSVRYSWVVHALNLVLLFGACTAAVHVLKLTSGNFPPTPWEESIYTSAAHFGGLADIYSKQSLSQVPLCVSIYSPIYYGVLRFVLRIMGNSLLVGRWLSAAGLVSSAWLLVLVPRTGRQRYFRFVPTLLFLSIFPTLCWTGSFAKPEFLALPFSLAGLVAYAGWDQGSRGSKPLLTSAAFCTLALLFKPTVLAGTAAIGLDLLWRGQFRRLMKFSLLVIASVAAFYAYFSWRTRGGFWTMTVVANNARLLPGKILDYALNVYLPNPIIVFGLAAAVMLLVWEYRENRRPGVWTMFFLLALGWFFLSAGRPGGSYNYFLEAAAGCAVVSGLFLDRVAESGDTRYIQFAVLCLVLALLTNLGHSAQLVEGSYNETAERAQIVKMLSGLKMKPEDIVLADPQYAFLASRAGDRVIVNDSLMYSLMVDNGVVDDKPVLDVLRDHRVPYLFLAHDLNQQAAFGYGSHYWPPDVVKYLQRHYSCGPKMNLPYFGQALTVCRPNADSAK